MRKSYSMSVMGVLFLAVSLGLLSLPDLRNLPPAIYKAAVAFVGIFAILGLITTIGIEITLGIRDKASFFRLFLLVICTVVMTGYSVWLIYTVKPSGDFDKIGEIRRTFENVKLKAQEKTAEFVRGFDNIPIEKRQKSLTDLSSKGASSIYGIMVIFAEAQKQDNKSLKADLLKALSSIMKVDLTARYSPDMKSNEYEKFKSEVLAWQKERGINDPSATKGNLQ